MLSFSALRKLSAASARKDDVDALSNGPVVVTKGLGALSSKIEKAVAKGTGRGSMDKGTGSSSLASSSKMASGSSLTGAKGAPARDGGGPHVGAEVSMGRRVGSTRGGGLFSSLTSIGRS